jgi:hypothetical protein
MGNFLFFLFLNQTDSNIQKSNRKLTKVCIRRNFHICNAQLLINSFIRLHKYFHFIYLLYNQLQKNIKFKVKVKFIIFHFIFT